ncbi:hypothetical protein MAQ5080_03224 [Marinomonas aquimarina]|uniref:Uncharacterized protein n=1 Tax=Marinomonas aquimarina TaxID=295068 RepID=A0A1A8TP19_9GAMM|nr:hypothetical protein MAQ5080_03224 [Marinomonas aquimarina]
MNLSPQKLIVLIAVKVIVLTMITFGIVLWA